MRPSPGASRHPLPVGSGAFSCCCWIKHVVAGFRPRLFLKRTRAKARDYELAETLKHARSRGL
jgi:hypothetical protein